MKSRMIRSVSPQGITTYEEVINLEGVIQLARHMYQQGVRTPRLVAMIKWLETTPKPTPEQFAAFLTEHNVSLVQANGDFVDN